MGDSIVAGLSRYPNVWNEYFAQINAFNLGIGGGRIENVLWRAIDLPLPLSVKNVLILCGTNNISTDTPRDIADSIISTGSILQKKSSGINVSICGLIPRDEGWSVNRVLINEVNEILKHQCNINGFAFIFQDNGWTFTNGSLDCSLFYKDMLHLIEKGNTSYGDITKEKLQSTISFLLHEHNFPRLSNVCQPILSSVSESHLYQRKPASNVKLVSVHVSSVYTSSVSELVKPVHNSKPVCSSNATQRNAFNASSVSQLIKPLNVSKPVCSSKETKRNICNANSVSQFTKPLNVSTPLCSSKATKRNVCNTGSVSKFIKPLNVCKTVCSNNTTRLNVCKVSSVSQLVKPSTVSKPVLPNNVCNVRNVSCYSQLVKTFNVTKSVCSSNASNSVICNSTCKPVSNFASDCQSVKPACKLKGVKWKRPHEQLVNNKNSHQHDFTKSFSAVNILMMSKYFYELVNKSNMSKNSIASDNNAFFHIILFVIFRVFNRKQRKYLTLYYLAMFLIVIFLLKLQIKDGLPSNFTSLQKCSTNEFCNLEI